MAIYRDLLAWILLWCAVVRLIRRVVPAKHAASVVSLVRLVASIRHLVYSIMYKFTYLSCLLRGQTYCATTVLWGSVTLLQTAWPQYAFDFSLERHSEQATFGIRDFILFSIAYFATDMVFDPDPRFLVHHILSIAAMLTTSACTMLEGTFLITAVIAEVGGVMYHVSKIVQRDWMTRLFLYVYSLTRLVLMPVFIGWLVLGLRHDFHWLYLWATSGTACLVGININWCFKQWARYHRSQKSCKLAGDLPAASNVHTALLGHASDTVTGGTASNESGPCDQTAPGAPVPSGSHSKLVPYSQYHDHKTLSRRLSEHIALIWDILS